MPASSPSPSDTPHDQSSRGQSSHRQSLHEHSCRKATRLDDLLAQETSGTPDRTPDRAVCDDARAPEDDLLPELPEQPARALLFRKRQRMDRDEQDGNDRPPAPLPDARPATPDEAPSVSSVQESPVVEQPAAQDATRDIGQSPVSGKPAAQDKPGDTDRRPAPAAEAATQAATEEPAGPCPGEQQDEGETRPPETKTEVQEEQAALQADASPARDAGAAQADETARACGTTRTRKHPGRSLTRPLLLGLRVLTLVVCLVAVLFLSALLFFQLNTDRLLSLGLEEFTKQTGCRIEFASAGLQLFPLPALRLDNVQVRPDDNQAFAARSLTFAPNLLALLQGRFEPEEIILVDPVYQGRLPLRFEDLADRLGKDGKETEKTGSLSDLLPMHCILVISNGSLDVRDAQGATLRVRRLETDMSLVNLPLAGPLNGLKGSFSLGQLQLQTTTFAARLADVSLSGKASVTNPLEDCTLRFRARSAVSTMGLALAADVTLLGTDSDGLAVSGRLKGSYAFDGQTIPWALEGSVRPLAQGALPGSRVRDMLPGTAAYADLVPAESRARDAHVLSLTRLAMGDDVLALDGLLLADATNPAITGRLAIGRVSLTRWLDFARGLSPGLQLALDAIIDGHIDFYIDTKTLKAPRVRATAAGATFAGHGGVESWTKPVVFLDMTSEFVDLGRAIPEAVGQIKKAPNFGHKALTSMTLADIFPHLAASAQGSDKPDDKAGATTGQGKAEAGRGKASPAPAAGSKGKKAGDQARTRTQAGAGQEEGWLSYDIRLKARKIHYGYVDLTDGGVVITPGRNGKGDAAARLDMQTNIYDGSCKGVAYFSGEEETEYEFEIATRDVNMAKLQKALDFLPISKGKGQCRVHVTSRGSEIDDFLANLRGTNKVILTGAAFTKDPLPLSPFRAEIDLALSRGAFRNSSLGLAGNWNVRYQGRTASADVTLQGMFWFGGEGKSAGVRCDALPFRLDVEHTESLLTMLKARGVNLKAQGRTTIDTAKLLVKAEKAHVESQGLVADGDLTVQAGNSFRLLAELAKAKVHVPELARTLTGEIPEVPGMLERLTFTNSDLVITKDRLRLTKFSTHVDGIPLSGTVTASFAGRLPNFDFLVQTGAVNLDHYLDKENRQGRPGKGKAAAAAAPQAKPWDFSFMKKFSATGTLRTKSLTVRKVHLQNLVLPLHLELGRLDVTGLAGSLYGGTLSGRGQCTFSKGLSFATNLQVKQFDVGAMLRDRKTRALFTGKMDFAAALASSMTGPGQLTRSLNGRVSFQGGQGSYQAVDDNFRPEGKPTFFTRSGSSATVTGGVLETRDFILTGEDLTLLGHGWIDLNTETMDLRFTADMPHLPQIPLRLHGTFDKPETSISGGMVILNAIGSFFKGIFNLIGGLFGIFM